MVFEVSSNPSHSVILCTTTCENAACGVHTAALCLVHRPSHRPRTDGPRSWSILPTQGQDQRQEAGSSLLSSKCEVKHKLSFSVLFRLA